MVMDLSPKPLATAVPVSFKVPMLKSPGKLLNASRFENWKADPFRPAYNALWDAGRHADALTPRSSAIHAPGSNPCPVAPAWLYARPSSPPAARKVVLTISCGLTDMRAQAEIPNALDKGVVAHPQVCSEMPPDDGAASQPGRVRVSFVLQRSRTGRGSGPPKIHLSPYGERRIVFHCRRLSVI
jgi:hypothetical protein